MLTITNGRLRTKYGGKAGWLLRHDELVNKFGFCLHRRWMASSSESRSQVKSRLESLFSTPRSSLDAPRSSSDLPRSCPASPLQSHTSMTRSAPSSFKLRAPSSSQASSLKQTPVVRWLGSTDVDKATGDDDSEAPDALKQAMEDEPFAPRSDSPIGLVRPPQAHIASHARAFRQPALLGELARAARPTASSPVPLSAVGSSSPTFSSQTPNIFSQHPPTRTSVDYLRSLNSRDRGISTTAVSHAPSSSGPTRWWFQDGNKAEVDHLLGEEDRASTVQKEAENIRQKCPFTITYFYSSLLTMPFSTCTYATPAIQIFLRSTLSSFVMDYWDLI